LDFHCARRLRVFARDILRLGTAMIELLLLKGPGARRETPASAIALQDSR
jgi:hypothetical protein